MSEEEQNNVIGGVCGLCHINSSKYCCPRCEVFYCSLDCYKCEKHLQCSESFYRDCVNQELASNDIVDGAKQKMMDILKKMYNSDLDPLENIEHLDNDSSEDSDDESAIDLHSRIMDLNLNDPDAVWNVLTNDERNEFEAIINSGEVALILPTWEPWWMYYKEKELIQDVENENKFDFKEKCPPLRIVPEFKSLTSVKPSPCISFNISNILASYAFVLRYFNGEIEPLDCAECLLDICSSLTANTNYKEMDVAIESVAQNCLQSTLIETDKESLDVMKHDVLRLLQGPDEGHKLYYSKAALSSLIQLFIDSKSQLKVKKIVNNKNGEFTQRYPDHKNVPSNLDKTKINKVIKKLEFYLSFLNTCDAC